MHQKTLAPGRRSAAAPPPSMRRQRGAAAVFTAVALIALVAVMALAIDVGQLYYAQRDLEKAAVFAATDAARVASGCARPAGQPGSLAEATQEAIASINRNNTGNGLNLQPGFPQVQLGRLIPGGTAPGTSGTGYRQFQELTTPGDPKIDAVRVTLARSQPPLLVPFITAPSGNAGGGLLRASATVQQAAKGSFFLGTEIASLNKGLLNQLLGGLLCKAGDTVCQQNIIRLDLASASAGLLATNISLGQLALAAGVTVYDLSDPLTLASTTPLLRDLLPGLGDAIGGNLAALLRNLGTAATNPNGVPLGQLLGAVDAIAADVPIINLLDLILAAAEAANADPTGRVKPIQLPINLDIPGVATVATFVKIGEPPRFSGLDVAGRARAETAEVTLLVRISAGTVLATLRDVINGIVNGLLRLVGALVNVPFSVTVLTGPLNIGVDVEVAQASATLDRLQCPTGGVNNGSPIASLSASPALAKAAIGTFIGNANDAPLLSPRNADLQIAEVNIDATCAIKLLGRCTLDLGKTDLKVSLGFSTADVSDGGQRPLPAKVTQFHRMLLLDNGAPLPVGFPPTYLADGGAPTRPPSATNPQTVPSPTSVQLNLALHNTQTPPPPAGLVGVLGSLVSSVLTATVNLLQPILNLVNTLASRIIDPLLNVLGIQLGSAIVTMDAVVVPQPQLFTTCKPGDTTSIECAAPAAAATR